MVEATTTLLGDGNAIWLSRGDTTLVAGQCVMVGEITLWRLVLLRFSANDDARQCLHEGNARSWLCNGGALMAGRGQLDVGVEFLGFLGRADIGVVWGSRLGGGWWLQTCSEAWVWSNGSSKLCRWWP
ncbi:hypothetical protein SESBI_35673 [Sesbania bispinosa]|nr:hypothetical protein SESBI_35673 [Sesbania bispinosa]